MGIKVLPSTYVCELSGCIDGWEWNKLEQRPGYILTVLPCLNVVYYVVCYYIILKFILLILTPPFKFFKFLFHPEILS